ncbi:MAG TPA: mechanosensitive ion channel family protein, partial [Candidatus Melainabacteria bacterium]|nr:mechanosensitive ion channel family protein [Candidatus Melainabacteria bacterium]
MARIYAEMHLNIQDRFHKKGIEILSPAYSAIRDGNKITIPANQLSGEYQAPSFNVNLIEKGGKL